MKKQNRKKAKIFYHKFYTCKDKFLRSRVSGMVQAAYIKSDGENFAFGHWPRKGRPTAQKIFHQVAFFQVEPFQVYIQLTYWCGLFNLVDEGILIY